MRIIHFTLTAFILLNLNYIQLEVKEKVVLSLPLPLQIGLGYSVATEKSSQLVDALSTLVSPTELNSNRSPAPSERSLIVMREGAEPKLSHRSFRLPNYGKALPASGLVETSTGPRYGKA